MTPEQKAGLMQLMGQTYGEAHKNDQMIVGQSGNLSPTSQLLKSQLEQVIRTPTVDPNNPPGPPQGPPPQQAPPQPPMPVQPVTPEQAAQEIASAQQPEIPNNTDQLELDLSEPSKVDKVICLIEEQNLLLKQISLKLDNGKVTQSKKQK
jgi:hypothetical protein